VNQHVILYWDENKGEKLQYVAGAQAQATAVIKNQKCKARRSTQNIYTECDCATVLSTNNKVNTGFSKQQLAVMVDGTKETIEEKIET